MKRPEVCCTFADSLIYGHEEKCAMFVVDLCCYSDAGSKILVVSCFM